MYSNLMGVTKHMRARSRLARFSAPAFSRVSCAACGAAASRRRFLSSADAQLADAERDAATDAPTADQCAPFDGKRAQVKDINKHYFI